MEKYVILEDYNAPDGVYKFFEDNNLEFSTDSITKHMDGKITLFHTATCRDEDVLFLSIKYPDLIIKKISKLM